MEELQEVEYESENKQTSMENGGQDTKSDEPIQEIRVLIDNHQVGGIIGKGGANVSRVREESGAFVSILKAEFRNVTERIMVLKGSATQIAQSTKLISDLMVQSALQREKKEFDANAENTTALRFLVHKSTVGAIIGKGGAVIKDTQAQTGARVQVSNDPLPRSTEKSVTLTGSSDAISKAAYRVLCQLRDNPLKSGTKVYPYVPGQPMIPEMPFGGMAPYGQQAGPTMYAQTPILQYGLGTAVAAASQPTSTQKIAIPTICAGCVIGKRGSVIRELRIRSGCNISIADPEPNNQGERVVTLQGTAQGIQMAVYLIRQLVEQYQPPTTNASY
jgi:transcription antitermination factor NusA-like protein